MELTFAIIFIVLLSGLSVFLGIRLSSLSNRISNELQEFRTESERVSNELQEARAENERVSNELQEARNESAELREENENLVKNLNSVIESNENALWLLYLLQVALQMSITALHDEQQQLSRLQKGYRNFVDEVKSKRDQRLMRKGLFIVLNLIPGVSVLSDLGDILSDIGDIGDISDIAEGTTEVNDPELEDLAIDSEDPMALTASAASARSILGISTEQQALKEPEGQYSDFVNTIIKNAIGRLEEVTKSLTPAERRKIITRITVEFGGFGIEYYRYEETGGTPRS